MTQRPINQQFQNQAEYFKRAFSNRGEWSYLFPNLDEAYRAGLIMRFLSRICESGSFPLRIIDVGCGRGWLTQLASNYGICDGVDTVEPVVERARQLHPNNRFFLGTAGSLVSETGFEPYDVVLCSEVIEHVPYQLKEKFVEELKGLLKPGGNLILTTPRGELYYRWIRQVGAQNQLDGFEPIEDWLTEPQVQRIFHTHGFTTIDHSRTLAGYRFGHPMIRVWHKMSAILRQSWLEQATDYLAGIYQIWWFRMNS